MRQWIAYILLLFIAIMSEVSLVTMPFSLIMLISLAVVMQKKYIFIVGCLIGVCLDSVLFRPLGVTSLLFTLFLGGIFLYQKKFEIKTAIFVSIASMLCTWVYLLVFGYHGILAQVILCGILGIASFYIIYFIHTTLQTHR